MLGDRKNVFKISLVVTLAVLLVVSVGTAAGASHMDGEDGELRVVHASPDAPNVDVYVDGDAVLEDVAFKDVSGYLELPPDTYEIEVTAAGDPDASVFNEDVEVGEGAFTALAIGELDDDTEVPFTVDVLEDDNSMTAVGEARVRAVHASPDAPDVDITVGEGEPLFENVGFGESGYVEVPAGEYTLEIRVAQDDADGDVVTTFDLDAEAGTVYTAFAVGYVEPDEAPADEPFDVVAVVDAEPGESVETAVTFEDQTSDGDSVVVAESSHSEEYVVVIHEDDEGEPGDIIGHSGDLEAGVNEDVTVTLDETLEEGEHTLHAMLHETDDEDDWGPSLSVDDETVVDSAVVTVEVDDDDEVADEEEGLPGFTVVAALVALLGAAFMLARRDG